MTPSPRLGALCAATMLLLAFFPPSFRSHGSRVHAAPGVTWRREIAPLVYQNCTSCHHAGGSGPFSLMTYQEVARRASLVQTATQSHYMPPWLPKTGPGMEPLEGDRHLADHDIALIAAWVRAGTPEGDGPVPLAPVYPTDWQLGPPDLVVEMPSAMHVPASGSDLFENFALPVPIPATRWVRAMEIKPGSPQVTHHANVTIDRTASVRRQHPGTWQQGIPGMDLLIDSGDRFDPDGHFLFWKPDSTALVEPEGTPWRLDPGNDLVLNMHLKPTGKPETVQARIGLYFTQAPPTSKPMLLQLEADNSLDIPAGDSAFVVEDHLNLPVAVDVLGIYPHAHYLGKKMEAWAILPSGERHNLVLIEDWDIDRQSVYRLARPLSLPAESVIHMRYTYDNSAANLRNPNTPPIRVRAGNRSADEMAHFWLQVLPRPRQDQDHPDPRLVLEQAWMENRIGKNPHDPLAQYNLASLQIEAGRPEKAAQLYREILTRSPGDTRALTALGSALALAGDAASAEQQFSLVLSNEPENVAAAFDLAALDLDHDRFAEAEPILRKIVAKAPTDVEAQRMLAVALGGQQKFEAALTPLQAWASLVPGSAEPHRALAAVYGALGRPADALNEQSIVVKLAPERPADWNDLGVMEARAGDRIAARRAFEHALTLDPANQVARNNLGRLGN